MVSSPDHVRSIDRMIVRDVMCAAVACEFGSSVVTIVDNVAERCPHRGK